MRRLTVALTTAAVLAWAPAGFADDTATPEEVITKVRAAADYLEQNGKSGLETFNKADSPFIWKDAYVFVFDCAAGIADIAHPVASIRNRKVATDKDAAGNVVGPEMCEAAKRPGGGWEEYKWWKPVKSPNGKIVGYEKKVSRKVSYMLSVRGQPYEVGAGVYNNTLTVAELDHLLKKE